MSEPLDAEHSPERIAIAMLDALRPDTPEVHRHAVDILVAFWRNSGELDDILLLPTPFDLDNAFRRARERCRWPA